jgi:hypothetical protein
MPNLMPVLTHFWNQFCHAAMQDDLSMKDSQDESANIQWAVHAR